MKKFIFLAFLVFSPMLIKAQTENILLPSDLKQQTIVTEPPTLRKGFLRAGLVGSFGVVDKYFNEDGDKIYFFESAWASMWAYTMLIQYGISDRLTVELWLPYKNERWNYSQLYYSPGTDQIIENSWDLKAKGLSDISVAASYQIITETDSRPSLVSIIDLTIPTGEKNPTNIEDDFNYDLPTGYGEYVIGLDLRARKINYPFSYTAYVHYLYHLPGKKKFSSQDTEEIDFKSGDRIDFGGSFNFHLNEWIALSNELNYFYSWKGEQEGVQEEDLFTNWAISYETRLVFQIRRVRVAEAVRIPLKGRNVSADALYVMLVQYTF